MEHPKRALMKALTWRLGGAFFTIILVYVYSGKIAESLAVGSITEGIKVGLFYLHERLWNRINFGRGKPPEYEI